MSVLPALLTEVTLAYPVTVDGARVEMLRLRRPKARDYLTVSRLKDLSPAEQEMRLIANLAEVTPETIEDLDFADYLAVQEVLKGFSQPGGHQATKAPSVT